jgi:surface protein
VFNQSVANFDTAAVTNMAYMFYGCTAFNGSVANFDTAAVTDMSFMFAGCAVFNQSVATFDTAAVTDMSSMFDGCTAFNQSVANFDTAAVTSMQSMFYCTAFNQDLSGWNIEQLGYAADILMSSAFSTTNYDLLLVAWAAQSVQNNVDFSAGSAKYSEGDPTTARAVLTDTYGWSIWDGGPV